MNVDVLLTSWALGYALWTVFVAANINSVAACNLFPPYASVLNTDRSDALVQCVCVMTSSARTYGWITS